MTAVGLVGFGRWGKLIFRDLRALGAEVHVAVPNAAAQAAALTAGAASVHSDCRNLPRLDGYVIAVPTVHHAEIALHLLDRNCALFIEKPLCDNPADARRLVELAGDRIFVMDKWRYHPGIEEIGRLARSGALGDILSIRTYRLGWGNPHDDVDATWILMPHDLSIVIEILGHLPAARAAHFDGAGLRDSGMIGFLRDADGPDVVVEVSALHPVARRSVLVIGTIASVQLQHSQDDRIFLSAYPPVQGTPPAEIVVGTEMPLHRELSAFLSYLRGGPAPRSNSAEGLQVVVRIAELQALARVGRS